MPAAPAIITALAAATATGFQISTQRGAAKRAKGQFEQAERIRGEEREKTEVLAKRAEAPPAAPESFEAQAKEAAAQKVATRRRRRTTLLTGPRGILTEPTVTKPTLLGA